MFQGPVKCVLVAILNFGPKKPKIQKIIHKYPKKVIFIIRKYRKYRTIYLFKAPININR
jgi:hypothetical protein